MDIKSFNLLDKILIVIYGWAEKRSITSTSKYYFVVVKYFTKTNM